MKLQQIPFMLLIPLLIVAAVFAAFPDAILRLLIVRDVPTPSDAIVLLAGSMAERAPTAAMLYRQGYAPRVLVSDDGIFSSYSPEYNRNLYQVEWAEEELVRLGVPRRAIVRLPFLGSGTIYESMATKREVQSSAIRTIIVVTSDYHTRRAGWTFRHTLGGGSIVQTFPARSEVGRRGLLVEVVKLVYYRVRFGFLGLGVRSRSR